MKRGGTRGWMVLNMAMADADVSSEGSSMQRMVETRIQAKLQRSTKSSNGLQEARRVLLDLER